MRRTHSFFLLLAATLLGCQSEQATRSGAPESTTSAPNDADAEVGSKASADATASAKPRADAKPPAGATPPIQDVSVDQTVGPVTVQARLLLTKVTAVDGIRVALRVSHAPGHAPKKGISVPLDWQKSLGSLEVQVTRGKVTKYLTLASPPSPQAEYLPVVHDFVVDGQGLRQYTQLEAWKDTHADLLAEPGRYSVRLLGTLATEGEPKFDLGPLEVEVVEATDDFKSIDDLQKLAQHAADKPGSKPASPRSPVIEDTVGSRWFRFTQPQPSDESRYDIDVTELLLSPAGEVRARHAYKHFTCVAVGTPIATPSGQVLIERLMPGAVVWGWDDGRDQRVETTVREVVRSSANTLVNLGGLQVTPEHPVFADGQWVSAGQLGARATLLSLAGTEVHVGGIVRVQGAQMVLDLSVDWPHNFFAGGFLVHNKAAHVPLGPRDDIWRGIFSRSLAKAAP